MQRTRTKLLALALGLVLACLAAEVGVLAVFGEQPRFPRRVVAAPWGLRYNEPGATYRHRSADVTVHFRINAQGMRAERDYPYAKPAGVLRLIALGDSFTLGYESKLEDCFASVLERELNAAGIPVEVLNAGVSGFSTAEEYLYLQRELIRYDPDLVLLSFYENDLRDNVRSGLFALEDGELVPRNTTYVPAGGLANFLNTNPLFNLLSERSNAFVFLKERATLAVKRVLVWWRERLRRNGPETPDGDAAAGRARVEAREELAAAILAGLAGYLDAQGVPLVVHSIPFQQSPGTPLVDRFPYEHFRESAHRQVTLFAAKQVLDPHVGEKLLYWQHSGHHWTPFANEAVGKALARLIVERELLPVPSPEKARAVSK